MSILLHVHRASEWFDSDLQPIDRWEWDAHASLADDLVIGEDGLVTWQPPEGEPVELDWIDGRIVAENRDAAVRARLHLLAAGLGGVLQGDDCELYGPDGEELTEEEADAIAFPDPPRRPTYSTTVETPDDRLWDPDRPRSRGELLRSLFRRE